MSDPLDSGCSLLAPIRENPPERVAEDQGRRGWHVGRGHCREENRRRVQVVAAMGCAGNPPRAAAPPPLGDRIALWSPHRRARRAVAQ